MTVERHCVVCGEPFLAAADEDLCPACAGSAEPERLMSAPGTLPAGGVPAGTLPAEPAFAATRRFPTAALVPGTWEPGDVLLDQYEVRGILGEGGMGTVYRVHHLGWNLELAVKSPKPELLDEAGGYEAFTAEAEAWVDLGLHPHIVTCHYVRVLGGIPRVFAELVEGGSLKEWIEDGRLYRGTPSEALARLLDVAIGFAWGLGYAHVHERGLVHQDVKPANVLLTPDGVAKVTDFGLVGARPQVATETGQSIRVEAGRYTPAYASPEQHAGETLDRRTDVWSWAVSVLVMFWGDLTWEAGWAVPPLVLEQCAAEGPVTAGPPPMPASLAALLRECLAADPAGRPHDFDAVAGRLAAIYREATGADYPRTQPRPAELLADQLNNKALSLLDLGREAAAERLFAAALVADPHHPEATYNQGLRAWRRGEITDLDLVARLEEVRVSHPADWRDEYLLAQVHIERGDADAARELLEAACRQAPGEAEPEAAAAIVRQSGGDWCAPVSLFEGETTSVALSADGSRVVSGHGDMTVRVWDRSGELLRTLEVPESTPRHVATSADGHRLAAWAGDATVRVWDADSGALLQRVEVDAVTSVALSADPQLLVYGAVERTVLMWGGSAGDLLHTLEGHDGWVSSVAVSADGRLLVSGDENALDGPRVLVWDARSGRLLHTLEAPDAGDVSALAVSAAGQVVSGDLEGIVRVWDAVSGELLRTLPGPTGNVAAVALAPDARLVCADRSGFVRVWDMRSGQLVRTLDGRAQQEFEWRTAAVSADGSRVVSAASWPHDTMRIWSLGFGPPAGAAPARPSTSEEVLDSAARFRRDIEDAREALREGRSAAAAQAAERARGIPGYERHPELRTVVASAGRSGRRLALRGAWALRTLVGHGSWVRCVAVSADGHRMVSGGGDKTLRVWDGETGEMLQTLETGGHLVSAVAMTSDGRLLVSGGVDRAVRVWDAESGTMLHALDGHAGSATAVALTPDGLRAVSGGVDGTVRIWDAGSGDLLRTLDGDGERPVDARLRLPTGVKAVAVSADGRRVIASRIDRARAVVRIWDGQSGELLRTLETPVEPFRVGRTARPLAEALAVSADGRRLVGAGPDRITGGEDRPMWVWDVNSGELLRTFGVKRPHPNDEPDWVRSVALSVDGRLLVSGGSDRTVRVWDVESGTLLRTLEGHTDEVTAVALTADSRLVVSGSDDETVRVWELDWDYEFPEPADWDDGACPCLGVFLTRHTPYGGDRLTRQGAPSWDEADFDELLADLGRWGYGWLRPDGVRRKLAELATGRARAAAGSGSP